MAVFHLLMKYKWKPTSEGLHEDRIYGQESEIEPTAKVLFKRRKEVIAPCKVFYLARVL